MAKIYYTLEEARRILPKVKPLIKRLMEIHLKISVQGQINIGFEEPFDHYVQSIKQATHWHRTQQKFFSLMEDLARLGVFVKSPEVGLVDFYSKHDDREIFLCYQYPAKDIIYWHEVQGGFAGRQSVSLLNKSAETTTS